jgi:hypothetical protein
MRFFGFSADFAFRLIPLFNANVVPSIHIYEVRPRNDKRSVDLISNALPFGRRW